MSCTSRINLLSLIALFFGGSAISQIGFAHSEGIEAADPSTPAALLIFEGAVVRYSNPNEERLHWRELYSDGVNSSAPMRHLPHSAPSTSKRLDHSDIASANSAKLHQ